MFSFRKFLIEKQIIVGKGARYGQVVFLAGGAGSGKGFATTHFLEGNKFKIRDVDEWKKAFLKLAAIKNKYAKLRRLDLRKPKDVEKLHIFVKEKGIADKTLNLLLSQAKKGRLPNLMIDSTLKDKEDIIKLLPLLFNVGYNPINIHIVWVLTNYYIAVQQNKAPERGRIVPDDILLKTHEGVAGTMFKFINAGTPRGVNGSVHVILGGAKHTVFWNDPKTGEPYDGSKGRIIVKDFKYLTLKEPGKPMTNESALKSEVFKWIKENAPKTKVTKEIFGSGRDIKEDTDVLPEIYCDLDQVLVDFLGKSKELLGHDFTDHRYWGKKGVDKREIISKKDPNFFRNLDWMPDGKRLWKFIENRQPTILSAYPSWMKTAKRDKAIWSQKNLGVSGDKLKLVKREEKRKYAVSKEGQPNILIDDHPKNIREWQAAGGVAILHVDAASTVTKLNKMGF